MQAVLNYLNENQERFVRELCDYLRFPKISAQPNHKPDLQACAKWLKSHCESIGLETRLCPTAGNPIVLAKTPRPGGGKRPHFLVYGHYDVQPPEPFEFWKSPPFEPRIEGRTSSRAGRRITRGSTSRI